MSLCCPSYQWNWHFYPTAEIALCSSIWLVLKTNYTYVEVVNRFVLEIYYPKVLVDSPNIDLSTASPHPNEWKRLWNELKRLLTLVLFISLPKKKNTLMIVLYWYDQYPNISQAVIIVYLVFIFKVSGWVEIEVNWPWHSVTKIKKIYHIFFLKI